MSVNDIQRLTGTTFTAANQLVERLHAAGILQEVTGQARRRRFSYAPYVRLFSEEPDAAQDA